jgi:hypothetical protein
MERAEYIGRYAAIDSTCTAVINDYVRLESQITNHQSPITNP